MIPDGKTPDCPGKPEIIVYKLDDLAGWLAIENHAKANRINVFREVKLVMQPGGDPRLPNLLAQRERQLAQ